MRRRDIITLLGGTAAAWSLTARPQQRMPMIGVLSSFTQTQSRPQIAEFRRGLYDNGLAEGQNVAIEYLFADGRYDHLPALAAELAQHPVDLIFAAGPPAALAAKAATTTIPVVFVVGFDPVVAGLVASLGRPGGNVTGMTLMNNQLGQKRLEVLLDLIPKATEIAMLVNPVSPDTVQEIEAVQAAMPRRGVQLRILNASTLTEIDAAINSLLEKRPHAVFVAGDPFYLSRPDEVVARMARLGASRDLPVPRVPGIRWTSQLRKQ
jgi:putative ABC transport system substrate-binding protein